MLEAPLKKGRGEGEMDRHRLMDRSLLAAALTAQLSLRRSVLAGQSGGPGVTLPPATDGAFAVIGGDITPGSNASE